MSPLAVDGYATEEATVFQRLNAEWASRTPVAWPGRAFNRQAQEDPWIEARITSQSAFRVTLGPEYRTRHPGLLMITVHWPHGQGTHAAREMAEDAARIFEGQTIAAGLTFRDATVRSLGEDDGWLRVQATIPFQRDTDHPLPD